MQNSIYLESPNDRIIAEALDSISQKNITVMALVAERDKGAITQLQQQCRERDIILVGGMFPELIVRGRRAASGILLSVLEGDVPYLLTQVPEQGWADSKQAAALNALISPDTRHTMLLMVDAMVAHTATLLEAIYFDLGDRVEYAGASAGSESFQPMPCLFDGDQFIGDAVLAVLLPLTAPATLAHGFPIPEQNIYVTSSDGNCIRTIDWRPAFEVYCEMAQAQYGVAISRDNFYEHAVHMPFGILQANGQVIVRIPVAINDDGAIFCVGEVPESTILVLLEGPSDQLYRAVCSLAERVAESGVNVGLLFYCAGRRMHLGDAGVDAELAAFAERCSPPSGALSLGEFGTVDGQLYPAFHNATLVHCPIA